MGQLAWPFNRRRRSLPDTCGRRDRSCGVTVYVSNIERTRGEPTVRIATLQTQRELTYVYDRTELLDMYRVQCQIILTPTRSDK